MAKQQKRDKAYYEERLIRDHPAIYADYVTGKYRTVTEAAITAGLKVPRTRLQELKNAWLKASAYEQQQFEYWLHTQHGIITPHPATMNGANIPIAAGRHLLPWAKSRIRAIMLNRRLKIGNVMDELGFTRLDASVGQALVGNTQLQPKILTALEIWLDKNKHI